MKNKADKGWTKELAKPKQATEQKKAFNYSKPVVPTSKPNAMGTTYRAREFRSVKQDKTTNLVSEQTSAKQSHKGK